MEEEEEAEGHDSCSRIKECFKREFQFAPEDKEISFSWADDYFVKCWNPCEGPIRRAHPYRILVSWIGSFIGIALVGILHQYFFSTLDLPLLYGSMGATAVLLYAAPNAPLSQPRNLFGGHIISAFIGVSIYQLSTVVSTQPVRLIWISAALAVSLSIVAMHVTKTLHPPGGATAMIAVIGSEPLKAMGFLYVLCVALDISVMFVVALCVDNIPHFSKYPKYWF